MRLLEKWANYMKNADNISQEIKPSGTHQATVTLSSGNVENNVRIQEAVEPQPISEASAPAPEALPSRGTWGGKHEFLLSCIGYCVGLGNVWRFPYLCYRNGGGVFLIPYCIMMLFTGLPLFLMELSLGQYGGAGPIQVWKCCPLLKGIGIGMLVVASLVSLYYNVIIAWAFFYLGNSFQSPLPWSCEAPANFHLCQNRTANRTQQSASEVFWNERALGLSRSSGLHDPGPVRWELAICLLAAWVIIFLCCLKGIRSSGKIVYVTATFPYLVLIVLIIRGATLKGSLQGVQFYLSTNWKRLGSAQVWNDAASQIFYSLGIGFGGLLSMASYNKFDNNVVRDTLIIVTGNCITSFFAGFAIFSILGHMAWKKGVPVEDVADSGPGLAFVAYPEALALLPGSFFWSILFFLMLFTLGIDTLSTSTGVNQFCNDITDMIQLCPPWCSKLLLYFKACWALFTPLLLLFILMYVFIEMYNTPLHYGLYEFPLWGKALGVCLGVLCCIQIPFWAVVAVLKESGTWRDRFRKAIRPLNSWKVTGGDRMFTHQTVDVPFSVTLTDHDINEMPA
ncbi:sodium-dependent proline transporter [Scyliorhinus canicula]|uniref:sodium-dependent proline transporter n=1 Tax=Scyliorhinus canicula TaxID=7830 RepID=UPI0018F65B93|nr:sodium-dependent proline transporter [Scyliorhinus canicula]